MIKLITHLAILTTSILFYFLSASELIKGTFVGVLITTSISLFILICEFLQRHGIYAWNIIKSYFIRKIRVSCAYLYIIKHNDKYLLIKNNHRDSYQLVGGVFKRNAQSQSFLDKLEILDDDKLPTSGRNEHDLRLYIKGFQLSKFIKWYKTKNQREISYSREFYEELIEPGYLDTRTFPFPTFSFKKRIITPILRKPFFNCHEVLIFDIIELSLDSNQRRAIETLYQQGNSESIKWADIKTIRNEGYDETMRSTPYHVGDHTKWAIDGKYYKNKKN
ncbi:MAG: hypothetical protein JXR34_11485 [Bacteroidales bacterium]|nr:hypothetical protein [Bacteroidales bacterium]